MIEAIVDGVAVGMAVGPMLWLLLEGGAWIVKTIWKEWKRPARTAAETGRAA